MRFRSLFLIVTTLALAGCTAPEQFRADPATEYADYNCRQMQAELQLVNNRIDDISNHQVQNVIIGGSLSMMGYAVDSPDDGDSDLPNLKARQDALQHLLIKKDCAAQTVQ